MRTEDGYLIYQCLNGDSTAFGFIVDKYKKSVYASAISSISNCHDAQDITQEVFIKAYQNLRTLKRWDSFAGWLYRITANTCKDWAKSKSRRPDYEFVEDQEPDLLDHVSVDSYQEDVVYKSIRETLESLPEIYREVLTLRYFGGMSIKEISSYIGASTSTIDRRLREALSQLKEEIPAMIGTAYHQKGLPANFTFRIVEIVKKLKIHPISQMKELPYGISLATGLLITILSINPTFISFKDVGTPIFSPLPSESKVLKVGEIPVDVVKTSKIPIISSLMGKGGEQQPDMQNAFFMAPQGEGGIWARKADIPTPRAALATSVVNGKIYAIGGAIGDGPGSETTMVEEYDPASDKWTEKSDMPTRRYFLSSSEVNGKIYAIGGWWNCALSTVEEYDPTNDSWTKKADMPIGVEGLSTSVSDGKIYAIGGWGAGGNRSTVQVYDPTTDTWIIKADMPTARHEVATCVLNGKIYVFGGTTTHNDNLSIVEEYDIANNTWTKKANMSIGIQTPCASVVNGKIYLISGLDNSGFRTNVEEYNPTTDTWIERNKMQAARFASSTSVVDGKIYAIGGWGCGGIVEEYTPEGWFTVSPQGKLPNTWGTLKAK